MGLADMLPGYDRVGIKDKWDAMFMIIKGKDGYYSIKDVELSIINIYKGDAYGLMKHLGIPEDAYYITMLLNDMKTPTELDIKHKLFKILDIETYKGMKYVVETY